MKTDWAAALAIAAMLAAGSAVAQTSAAPPPARTAASVETLDYVVQRGDTLIDLATAYMHRPLDYRRVQRENRVANPRHLAIFNRAQQAFLRAHRQRCQFVEE